MKEWEVVLFRSSIEVFALLGQAGRLAEYREKLKLKPVAYVSRDSSMLCVYSCQCWTSCSVRFPNPTRQFFRQFASKPRLRSCGGSSSSAGTICCSSCFAPKNVSLLISSRADNFITISDFLTYSFLLPLLQTLTSHCFHFPRPDLPRSARLLGNVQVCRPCSLADSLRHPGGVSLLLALIQTAQTPQTLRLALSLLVSSLRHNPKNAHDMARLRGYHLLAVFLRQHIDMVGHSELDLLLQLAGTDGSTGLASRGQPFGGVDDQGGAMHTVVLTDAPLVEDVLLDWTVWVAAPVPLQLAVLDFLESLAGHSAFREHNLAALRRMDAFQHLLVTLQRGDVTEPVLQKAVRLLGLFIVDGKHPGELKAIADFVVSTFRQGQAIEGVEYGEPRKPSTPLFVPGRAGRESDGYEVLVRNMVLDKLLELQVRLRGEEELEVWGKIVGSRVVTFLLDEDVHPSTLCLVLTMLAVSISTNPVSAAKFRASGGFQSITHVLPSFFDEPEVHGILLKLVLGRPVYPRQPAMGLEDFYALMPTGDAQDPVRFPELLEIIGSLFKAAFDAHDPHPIAPSGESSNHKLVAPGVENAVSDGAVDYSPRVTDSRGSTAEELATGLMQCLVKLAQRSPNLSQACRRQEFLEGYVELFFSCVRRGLRLYLSASLKRVWCSAVSWKGLLLLSCRWAPTFSPPAHFWSGKWSASSLEAVAHLRFVVVHPRRLHARVNHILALGVLVEV
jgi:hypothetical protein